MVRIAGCEHGKRIAGLREKLAAEMASWVCGVDGDVVGRGRRGWKEGLQLGGGVNIRETVREMARPRRRRSR
jgi:hypothetical protein